uniref:alpha/beta fold hydrolase n=1 Tax=uncultured Sphingomonas sp. TaxID=158754 RepID=UPI0025D8E759|nr:alpha/beta hydrolase [uncultured Sphingomonas sp.]
MTIQHARTGRGKPLLLIHGLGNTRRAWSMVRLGLAAHREVILLDLPGHGHSAAEADSGTFAGLARSLAEWLEAEKLTGVDMVGSSLGGRLVLEMARQGRAGATVALDPGGFWQGWERRYVNATLTASVLLLRQLRPLLPTLARNPLSRSALLAQLSAKPWALNGALVAGELDSFAATPTFDALLKDLTSGPAQAGPAAEGSGPVTIGWGRHDRLCFPTQALRAQQAFSGSKLVWFDHSGHFPMLDEPEATTAAILDATGSPGA